MVMGTNAATFGVLLVGQAATEEAKSPKLPASVSAAAFMAIIGILLVGMFLVAAVLLGGNWARRQGRRRPGPSTPPDRMPAAPERLGAAIDLSGDDSPPTGETMVDNSRGEGDTRPK